MEDLTKLLEGIDLEEVDAAMGERKRRGKNFTPQQKADAIKRVLNDKMTYVDAGRPIDAEGYYVRRWVHAFRKQVKEARDKARAKATAQSAK